MPPCGSIGRGIALYPQLTLWKANMVLTEANSLVLAKLALTPVSYTHLDVYKRQDEVSAT